MPKSLKDFAMETYRHGQEMMRKKGYVLPAIIFEDESEGQTYALIDPEYMKDAKSKDRLAMTIRSMLRQHKATRYAYISEAWMVVPMKGETITAPSKHPGRIEILAVQAADLNSNLVMNGEIHRNPDQSVDYVDDVEPIETSSEGRFANLLD